MKLMIAADLHGSSNLCESLLNAYYREKADKLILLGDLLYHGPKNDLPGMYDSRRTAELLNGFSENLLCVRGNCDSEADQAALDFPITAECAVILVFGRTIYAMHGHREILHPTSGDIVLRGHTHIPAKNEIAGVSHLNPGSVSLPRGGSRSSYMTFSCGTFLWKTLEGDIFDKKTFQ